MLLSGTVTQGKTANPLQQTQGETNFSIAVDPNDPTKLVMGGTLQPVTSSQQVFNAAGVNDWVGRVFAIDTATARQAQPQLVGDVYARGTAPHGDSRALVYLPGQRGSLLDADDGGLYRLVRPQVGDPYWVSLNGNLAVTELLSVAYDPYSMVLFGGTQDVGSQAQVAPGSGTWTSLNLGDGNSAAVTVLRNSGGATVGTIRYTMSNDLTSLVRTAYDLAGKQVKMATKITPPLAGKDASPDGAGFFPVALAVNAVDPKRLLVGRFALYESDNYGTSFTVLKGSQNVITALAYGGESANGAKLPEVAYMAIGGRAYYRESLVGNFQPATVQPPGAGNITAIVMDPENWEVAYAVDDKHLFLTIDHGQTWSDVTGSDRVGRASEGRPRRGESGQGDSACSQGPTCALSTPTGPGSTCSWRERQRCRISRRTSRPRQRRVARL